MYQTIRIPSVQVNYSISLATHYGTLRHLLSIPSLLNIKQAILKRQMQIYSKHTYPNTLYHSITKISPDLQASAQQTAPHRAIYSVLRSSVTVYNSRRRVTEVQHIVMTRQGAKCMKKKCGADGAERNTHRHRLRLHTKQGKEENGFSGRHVETDEG